MLHVKSPEEALQIIMSRFGGLRTEQELIPLRASLGRIAYEDIEAGEYVPDFNRSAMDGYAVKASDTFGCSDSLPSLLRRIGEAEMGKPPGLSIKPGECVYVHTGGEIPAGADTVVMIEYTEDYGDGTIGILSPGAPGENVVLRGDDAVPGKRILTAGHCIGAHNIGALSALGVSEVPIRKKPVVGIISTGNELVPFDSVPCGGQMRDVNSNMLEASVAAAGGEPRCFGISSDDEESLCSLLRRAEGCDLILISGGSSAGTMDVTLNAINRLGSACIHGIAIKPGKPTIVGEIAGAPVFGLPGHPVAAYFVFEGFAYPLICSMQGISVRRQEIRSQLGAAIPSNHGRAEYVAVRLERAENGITAMPVYGKSGLITLLSDTQGYIVVPRDCEGISRGEQVDVKLYNDFLLP